MKIIDDFEQNLDLVKQLGVTKSEFKVYVQLLSNGPCTKTDFAKRFKIPRTTVFAIAERLMQKGLITQLSRNNRNIMIAEDPKRLGMLVMHHQLELKQELNNSIEASKKLDRYIETLKETIPDKGQKDDIAVKYYIGVAGLQTVLLRLLDSASHQLSFISNIQEWRKIYTSKESKKYNVSERIRRDIVLRVLAVKNNMGFDYQKEDKEAYRETRFLPDSYQFKSTFLFSDKEVAIINAHPSYLVTAILLNDPETAAFYTMLFSNLWEVSSKVPAQCNIPKQNRT